MNKLLLVGRSSAGLKSDLKVSLPSTWNFLASLGALDDPSSISLRFFDFYAEIKEGTERMRNPHSTRKKKEEHRDLPSPASRHP